MALTKRLITDRELTLPPVLKTLEHCNERRDAFRILIVKMSSIGDVIQTLPVLTVLRENFPQATIDWAVEEPSSNILEGHPSIDRLIVFRRKEKKYLSFIRKLRSKRYHWSFDFQGTFKSAIITFLSRSRWTIGFDKNREPCSFLYNAKATLNTAEQLPVLRHLLLLRQLGLKCQKKIKHTLPLSKEDKHYVSSLFQKEKVEGSHWVLNAFSQRLATQWGLKKFRKLIEMVQSEYPHTLILLGSPQNFDAYETLSSKIPRVFNWSDRLTLKQSACVMQNALFSLSGDTGPMHLAASVGCPVVALFGSSNPLRTGPFQKGALVLQYSVDCQPCYKRCCPLQHHNCMEQLEVVDVYENLKGFLNGY